jgi:hypothetical protein
MKDKLFWDAENGQRFTISQRYSNSEYPVMDTRHLYYAIKHIWRKALASARVSVETAEKRKAFKDAFLGIILDAELLSAVEDTPLNWEIIIKPDKRGLVLDEDLFQEYLDRFNFHALIDEYRERTGTVPEFVKNTELG